MEPTPVSSSPHETVIAATPVCRHHHRGMSLVLLLLTLLSGFVGGLCAPKAEPYLNRFLPQGLRNETSQAVAPVATVITEENAVADLVAKNASGVVSIVISKDVPKVRGFVGNPFGMPFFNPFGGAPSPSVTGETEKKKLGSGSGFLVSSDGLIVTNKHVVADEQAEYTVILSDGTEHTAKVLARDPSNDIAVIKIEGKDLPVLSLGDSDTIRVGETILVIGNPLGEFENSVSRGIISGVKRNLNAGSGFGDSEHLSDIIQVDAAVNPGNSGGPLIDLSGAVVGVNVAMAQGAESIGFALPINQVKHIVEQVRTTGKLSFPYLGVRTIILNDALKQKTGLPFTYGALVVRGDTVTDFAVVPGSPADKAGIVENDIILLVDGKQVDTDHSLVYFMGQHSVGDEVTIKLWHKGETKDVKVTLEERQP